MSANSAGTGEVPTSSPQQFQQTMQLQPKCGNQQLLLQSNNLMSQNFLTTNTNGGFPQHMMQGGFFLNAMHSHQGKGTINAEEIWKSAPTGSVTTANVTSAGPHVNKGLNSLAHGGLNSAPMQHVQAQSHMNAQSFQGAPPLQYQPANQQHEDTNTMPPSDIGIDGGDVLSNKAEQVQQIPLNQPQQLQQFSQLAPPVLATSSSADAKMKLIIQQRHVIQQLELQLQKQNELQRNVVQTNVHYNGSPSPNNSIHTPLTHSIPFPQGTGQNAPTNSSIEFQPQLPQMQQDSFQMNPYQTNATNLPQQIKHSDRKRDYASIGGKNRALTEQDPEQDPEQNLRENENTKNLEQNMHIVEEQTQVHHFAVQPDCGMNTEMIEIDKAPASDVIGGSDRNKEQIRGNVHTQEKKKTVSSALAPGTWQTNDDLSDRQRIITCIFNAINGTKPRGKNISEKLPLMAKRLEERLYRSAKTKEDYTDTRTLKKRLQSLIFVMGGSKIEKKEPKVPAEKATDDSSVSVEAQQKIKQLKLIHRNMKRNINLKQAKSTAPFVQGEQVVPELRHNFTEEERRRNIRKQQHRLLLLRHASKCNSPICTTPYCSQMKTLWKHMSRCSEVNCKTPHCFSSRCVLNHYRICSKQNLTTTCEVCSPLIKRGGGNNHVGRAQKLRRAIVQTSGQKSREDFKHICSFIDESDLALPTPQSSEVTESGANNGKDIVNMKSHLVEQKKLQQRFLIMDIKQQQMQLATKQHSIKQQNKRVMPQSEEWHSLQSKLDLSNQYQHELQKQLLQLEEQCKKAENKDNALADEHTSEHISVTENEDLTISPVSALSGDNLELNQRSGSLNGGKSEGIKIRSAETSSPLSMPNGGQQVVDAKLSSSKQSNKKSDDHNMQVNETLPLSNVTANLPDFASKCMPLIRNLLDDPCGWVFAEPVNPAELGLPDYFDIIKKPMDLSLVKKKLEDKVYHDIGEFKADVLLVFQNAILYNGEDSEVGEIAAKFITRFGTDFKVQQREGVMREKMMSCVGKQD